MKKIGQPVSAEATKPADRDIFVGFLQDQVKLLRDLRIELAEASLKLCEWVPDSSKGSSGYIRKEAVKRLAESAMIGRVVPPVAPPEAEGAREWYQNWLATRPHRDLTCSDGVVGLLAEYAAFKLAQKEAEISRLTAERDEARHEAGTCDDVKLDQPLANIIAEIQQHREAAEAANTELRTALQQVGWVISNGKDTKFRAMVDCSMLWGTLEQAIRFARREDAEAFAAEDEDAWHIRTFKEAERLAKGE